MKIGVIVAMDSEYAQLTQLLGGKSTGCIGSNEVVIVKCGIGKVNAAVGVMKLLQQHAPDCVVSTGVAGGIDASLRVMDVVVSEAIAYHDVWCGDGNAVGQVQGMPESFVSDPTLLACAKGVAASQGSDSIKFGLVCSGDQFITDGNRLEMIKSNFPKALAVEMESGAIAHTCYLNHVPYICMRIISDTPGADPDNAKQYANFWGAMADRSFGIVHDYLLSLPESL